MYLNGSRAAAMAVIDLLAAGKDSLWGLHLFLPQLPQVFLGEEEGQCSLQAERDQVGMPEICVSWDGESILRPMGTHGNLQSGLHLRHGELVAHPALSPARGLAKEGGTWLLTLSYPWVVGCGSEEHSSFLNPLFSCCCRSIFFKMQAVLQRGATESWC